VANQNVTEVQIAKFALSRIGGENIEAFEPPENSTESQQVNLWYHHVRRETLELYDWAFARKRLTVALDSNDAPDGIWIYRYQYPADAIVVREIENPAGKYADPVPFEIELPTSPEIKTILCDTADAVVIYTANITTPSLYPPSFVNAFSLSLAAKLVMAVRGDEKMKQEVQAEYRELIRVAAVLDAKQSRGHKPREASWIEGR
jgi:hypothetical protein